MKLNYVIATYGGRSPHRERHDRGMTPHILKLHLQQLIIIFTQTTPVIQQVTIVKPYVPPENTYPEYYDIQAELQQLRDLGIQVETVDTTNHTKGVSYSQWRTAFTAFPDFDYYIVTEDDWCPTLPNFDTLLATGIEDTKADYLCMWYTSIAKLKPHAAISVGILTRHAFSTLQDRFPDKELDQFGFSVTLEHDLKLIVKDYSDNGMIYRLPFWETSKGTIFDFTPKSSTATTTVFAPLHLIHKETYGFTVTPVG